MTNHSSNLEYIIVEPKLPATAAVIWLHGLGADGHDFEGIVPALQLNDIPIRFIFPHAPVRRITINAGMSMRGWYDIISLSLGQREDETGVNESAAAIKSLIHQTHQEGIPYNRIILAGFSQGGAIALHLGIRHEPPLGGIMALSTYLPLQTQAVSAYHPATTQTPIFMAHGTADPIVVVGLGEVSRDTLTTLGYTIEWHQYLMAHQVCDQEIKEISTWIRARLT